MDELLNDEQINTLAELIAPELANRNRFALIDFARFVSDSPQTPLSQNCTKLHSTVIDIITKGNNISRLEEWNEKPAWISSALWFGRTDGGFNLDQVATHLCISLIQQKQLGIDEHITQLSNNALCQDLGIGTDDNLLVDLSDNRLELRNHGIVFDKSVLIYPHQFFRRYYSSNFVGMPALLRRAHEEGAKVSIRLDPLRKTTPDQYREIVELDHWYGPPFSEKLLKDTSASTRTLHSSRGVFNLNYDARFTVFRTKMMDAAIREFMVEEYCPLILTHNDKSPGIGERYCIQKFAHFCYDQNQNSFTHLDGAVRVFETEEYGNYFQTIASGQDIDDKAGTRHKMFLVEGQFGHDLAQELLTEWFRYNPHIQEYFSGKNIEPAITYEKLEEIQAGTA